MICFEQQFQLTIHLNFLKEIIGINGYAIRSYTSMVLKRDIKCSQSLCGNYIKSDEKLRLFFYSKLHIARATCQHF